jgi:hypothetical protein
MGSGFSRRIHTQCSFFAPVPTRHLKTCSLVTLFTNTCVNKDVAFTPIKRAVDAVNGSLSPSLNTPNVIGHHVPFAFTWRSSSLIRCFARFNSS